MREERINFNVYAWVSNVFYGPGHIIPALVAVNDIVQSASFQQNHPDGASVRIFHHLSSKHSESKNLIALLFHIVNLKNRDDINFALYGDGKIAEEAEKLIELYEVNPETSQLTNEQIEAVKSKLEAYVLFQSSTTVSKLQIDAQCLFVACADITSRFFDLSLPKAARRDFIFCSGAIGIKSFYATDNKGMVYIPRVTTTRSKSILLKEADVLILSSPKSFAHDFLGVITLAALESTAPILVFNDSKNRFNIITQKFIALIEERLVKECNEIFSQLASRLRKIKWEEPSASLNKIIENTSKPALFAEGLGALSAVAEKPLHFLFQPTHHESETSSDVMSGLIDAYRGLKTTHGKEGFELIVNYRDSFRRFQHVFNQQPFNAKTYLKIKEEIDSEEMMNAIQAMVNFHKENEESLKTIHDYFLDTLKTIPEGVKRAEYYYQLLLKLKEPNRNTVFSIKRRGESLIQYPAETGHSPS